MKGVRGRFVLFACLAWTSVFVLSGCTVGGKSFTLDSNSRIPFFGLELKERKAKSSAPAYQSISRTGRDSSQIKVALQTAPSAPRSNLKMRDLRLAATSIPGLDQVKQQPASTPVKLNPQAMESIPLPRTERLQRRDAAIPDQRSVDFQ